MIKPKVGFIGQGFIGKNYADDFENRGYKIVRYAIEGPYRKNKAKIKGCQIVFIAVPTPTTSKGFDDSIVRSAIALTKPGSIVVIKSTVIPGTTESIQKQIPDRIILHSPEFLSEATASYNAANPERNIVGIPKNTVKYKKAAELVLSVLPKAPFSRIASAREAEFVKYAGNTFLFFKILFANLFFDIAAAEHCDWQTICDCIAADPRIGGSHLRVEHASGHPGAKAGRGAGGHCFVKDFAALRELYEKKLPNDKLGIAVLRALESKNIDLLIKSEKDLDLLASVYGKNPKV